MKKCTYFLPIALMLILLTVGCGCNQEGPSSVNLFAQRDNLPPQLLRAQAVDSTTITIKFNEELQSRSITLLVNGKENANFLCQRESITLYLLSAMSIASSTRIEGRVEDLSGNSTRFNIEVWAYNPNRATLLINEFSTKGSGNSPDRVELLVLAGGNLAGITVANGMGPYAKDRCILGDTQVFTGDFIVIAFQAGAKPTELSSENLGGLSSNNGCITVTESPDWESPVMDAVLYSNKTTTTYGGFGSKESEEGARLLFEGRHWDSPLAENAIDSSLSTATRTLCREAYKDSNSEHDWYVCDTKESSFGMENSSKRYEP